MSINNFINLPDTNFLENDIPVTPSISLSVTPSNTPPITPTISVSPSFTPTHTVTPSISPSLSQTPTPTYSRTPTQTATPYPTPTKTPRVTPTPSETKSYFFEKNKQNISVIQKRDGEVTVQNTHNHTDKVPTIRIDTDCEVYEEKQRNEE
tara:strand:- start:387 stop:839 length:453 start_codon:yes stop_codon:yes gene_type:complete